MSLLLVLCWSLPHQSEEAQTGHCEFDDIPPVTVEALSSWLYFGKLFDSNDPST